MTITLLFFFSPQVVGVVEKLHFYHAANGYFVLSIRTETDGVQQMVRLLICLSFSQTDDSLLSFCFLEAGGRSLPGVLSSIECVVEASQAVAGGQPMHRKCYTRQKKT